MDENYATVKDCENKNNIVKPRKVTGTEHHTKMRSFSYSHETGLGDLAGGRLAVVYNNILFK